MPIDHPGLKALFEYPLMSALTERRTRRIARGTSVLAEGLSHTSTNAPAPLSPLEEAVLVVSTGLTGQVQHDGPLQIPGGGIELGTPFMNVLARSASSPDNAQATTFFMINDEGIWLLKRLRGREALAVFGNLPPERSEWSENDWLAAAQAVKVKLFDQRLEFPRRFPFYLGWNKQISNRPGTTILFPVVDCTRACINILMILLSEPDGERPLFVDDWQKFKPKDLAEAAAFLATKLGLVGKKIPYHVIGGLGRARGGFVNPEINLPLGLASTMRVDFEAFFLLQNLMLVGQAMGLGGWIHASIAPPYVFQRDPEKQLLGLGFRFHTPTKKWDHWPPVPSTQPNPVGIDGQLEGLCPPYVTSMEEAVDRVLEEKYGSAGAYGDVEVFKRSYNSQANAEEYLRQASHYSKGAVEYTKEICKYIFDTYGRFPAHVNAFHTPGVWLQFSHLEIEYYQKFFDPRQFHRQAKHAEMWGE